MKPPLQPVIVALGAGYDRKGIGLASRLRVSAAAVLYRRLGGIVVLSGGKTSKDQNISEAESMKNYITQHGRYRIPAKDIVVETTSVSTPENVRNVAAMLREMNYSDATILLVAGRRNRLQAAEYFRAQHFTVHAYTVRQVLMRSRSFAIPKHFEPRLSTSDRRRRRLFQLLRFVDPKGRLAARIGRWMRGG